MKFRKKHIVVEAYQTKEEVVVIDTLEGTMTGDIGDWIITGVEGEKYPCKPSIFEKTYELVEEKQMEKDLGITEVKGAKANIKDLIVYGDGDTFALLCKASSQEQGWLKSTKVCNCKDGCVMQVTTQQRNPDGSYSVAEALTYVPRMNIDTKSEPRVLKEI